MNSSCRAPISAQIIPPPPISSSQAGKTLNRVGTLACSLSVVPLTAYSSLPIPPHHKIIFFYSLYYVLYNHVCTNIFVYDVCITAVSNTYAGRRWVWKIEFLLKKVLCRAWSQRTIPSSSLVKLAPLFLPRNFSKQTFFSCSCFPKLLRITIRNKFFVY